MLELRLCEKLAEYLFRFLNLNEKVHRNFVDAPGIENAADVL